MSLRLRALAVFSATALTALSSARSADAYSTRVHMAIANDIRAGLMQSGDGTLPLKFSSFAAKLPSGDAQAIIDNPLEFRAGAVGPDNTAFPGMTDPSHAVEQRPYEQCQLLYNEAILPNEKAYALGCFLHGATDAIAHHYVNYMTGETFTLNPITANRESNFSNVVRHIVCESQLQEAAFTARPAAFASDQMEHSIPKSFVLRAYFDEASPLWQLMAGRAKAHFDDARAKNPGASLISVIGSAGLAQADHLILLPVYLREIDQSRIDLKDKTVTARIQELQDGSTADGATLGVTAGSDGMLGTSDDDTACSLSCPNLYATYKVYTALLEPRFDANSNPLPSAFDKVSEKLRTDLFAFMPAYIDTVDNVSTKLNEGLTPGGSQFGFAKSDLDTLMSPMTTWTNDITTIDFATLTMAVLPDWLISVQNALNAVGINIQVTDIIDAIFQPIIQPIKDAIKAYAVDQVKMYLGTILDQYEAQKDAILAEYNTRLNAAAGAGAPW